jgi:hypothetical protein
MGVTISHTDKIASLLLLALAVGVYRRSADFPAGFGETGSAFFPRVIAGLIAVFALFQFGKSVTGGTIQSHEVSWPVVRRVAVVAALVVAYVATMSHLGFVVGTFLFLVVTMRYSGVERYRRSVSLSAAATLVLYYVFFEFLRVPLPESQYFPIRDLLPPLPLVLGWPLL